MKTAEIMDVWCKAFRDGSDDDANIDNGDVCPSLSISDIDADVPVCTRLISLLGEPPVAISVGIHGHSV